MAQPKPLQALSAATLRLLRPLVRILLRNNVSHRTFAELAKLVYVEVANAEFGIAGKKQTISRIAILTGLTRKKVQRLLAQPPHTESVPEEEYHRASRVITGWVRGPDFGDGKGHPQPLGWKVNAHHSVRWSNATVETSLCERCWTNYCGSVR